MTIIYSIVSVLMAVLIEIRAFVPTRKTLKLAVRRGLRFGCFIGVGCGIFSTFAFSHTFSFHEALTRGLVLAIVNGFEIALLVGVSTVLRPPGILPKHHQEKPSGIGSIIDFLFFGMCGTIGFMSTYALQSGGINQIVLTNAVITGFFFGLVCALGNRAGLFPLSTEIKPAETVAWSWLVVRSDMIRNVQKGIMLGTALSVILAGASACISSFFYGIHYGLAYGAVFGSITGFIIGITSILTDVLTGGWESSEISDKQLFIRPNEGIRRSLYHALFASFIFGPVGGLTIGVMSGTAFGLVGIRGWLILGTGFSIVFAALLAMHFFFRYGGIAFIAHYLLRWYLWRAKDFPFNAIPFLDYAAERILLRKIGGGYIFAHRLLLEYFARLDRINSTEE